jgi:hypothetical protein
MNLLDPRLSDRFWAKCALEPDTGCWIWSGSVDGNGYGHIRIQRRLLKTHRVAYEAFVGPIADGLEIDHFECSRRRCCNPSHLRAVSHRENSLRSTAFVAANAVKTHCPSGHAYDEANTRVYRNSRYCRTCSEAASRISSREYQRRRRAARRAIKETP